MARLFANNAASTLASPALVTDLTLALVSGDTFPTPTGSDDFLLTLASGNPESAWEIVKVTARSGNTMTVVRAQEGTTAQAWAAGTKAELRLTAGSVSSFANQVALDAVIKDPTGFNDPSAVTVSYDSATRKITLTGTFSAYWQGELVAALTNGWVSTAHAATTGSWFLYFDGTNFVWSQTPWSFDMLHIAYVYYGASDKFAIRECHGMATPWTVHRELHEVMGTYLASGADLSSYTLGSTTASQRRPAISAATVCDEDIRTAVTALAAGGPYTQHYLSSTGTSTFVTGAADIVPLLGSEPYYNQFSTPNWVQTPLPSNSYMALWLVAIPTAADSGSLPYRFVWIQGQDQSNALSTIQALTFQSLNLGQITSISPEFVPVAKAIIHYTAGNWTIVQVDKLTLSRASQTNSTAGYLSAVTTSAPLAGLGTPSSPLSMPAATTSNDGYMAASTLAGLAVKGGPNSFTGAQRTTGQLGTGVFTVASPPSGQDGDTVLMSDALIPFGVQRAGDGLTVSFNFGSTLPSGSILTKTDWHGTQQLYPTARTNLVRYCSDLTNSAWIKTTGISISPDAVLAPDGTMTADAMTYSGSGTLGSYRIYQNTGAQPNGVVITTSVWMRSDTPVTLRLVPASGGVDVVCNLTSEWQRFTCQGIGNGSSTSWAQIYSAVSDNTPWTVYVWGFQAERNAYPTRLIPTNSTAVTITDYSVTVQGKVTFATSTTSVNQEALANGDGSTTVFPLLVNGASLPSAASPVVAPLYRTDWQGTQQLYPTARTNYCPRSATFDLWTQSSGLSTTANSTTAPDGTATADKLLASGASPSYANIGVTIPLGTQVVASCYLKNIDAVNSAIYIRNAVDDGRVVINWSGLTISSVVPSSGATAAGFVDMGGGWYRVWAVMTTAEANPAFRIYPNLGASTYSIYAWGAQLEPSNGPTSYIPTTTTAVTVTDYTLAYNSGAGRWEVTYATAPVSGATQAWSGTIQGGPANGALLTWNMKGGTVSYFSGSWRTYNGLPVVAGI